MAVASGLFSFLALAIVVGAAAWSWGAQRINAAGPLPTDKVVVVRPGNDLSVVSQLLEEGVIDDRVLMTAALWAEGNRGNVKSGEYVFKQAASLREVIDTLVSGKQILHAVTVPEGLTSEQVVVRLRENDVLIGDVNAVPGEGTLMPDTYKFSRGTTREQVIRSMQAEQKRIAAEVWSHRSPETPVKSPFEMVTLASIVEKETGRADERPRVAGVFVNRLMRNMPLQSDPTIVYGLVGGKGTLGRGILKSEIDQKTPYNTYANLGLPPGPIANPGRAALEAVANPSRTRELYFVADGTGGHAFAENLDQHRLNVTRWRQIESAREKGVPDADKPIQPGSAQPNLPRPDQRGAIDVNPGRDEDVLAEVQTAPSAEPSSISALPTFAQARMSVGFPVPGIPAGAATPLRAGATLGAPRPAPDSGTFDELDVEVGGLKSRADAAAWGEGDDFAGTVAVGEPAGTGSLQTFPVPAQHLADQRARAVALGLIPASGAADPADAPAPSGDDAGATAPRLYGKGKVIDASEGTSFDPLRDRTYDLTTAKVVPVITPMSPVRSLAAARK